MQKYVVIAAGGTGSRMKKDIPKQFLLVRNKPVICHTIERFIAAFSDIHILLTIPAGYNDTAKQLMEQYFPKQPYTIVVGGSTRFHSVQNGIHAIKVEQAMVFVQDAARCLLSSSLIQSCYIEALAHGNAVPCILPKDSLREVTDTENRIIDRSTIRIIQTPQTFYLNDLRAAFQQDYNEKFTDEASVMEYMGMSIHLIPGEENNLKITTSLDLEIAEWLLK